MKMGSVDVQILIARIDAILTAYQAVAATAPRIVAMACVTAWIGMRTMRFVRAIVRHRSGVAPLGYWLRRRAVIVNNNSIARLIGAAVFVVVAVHAHPLLACTGSHVPGSLALG